MASQKKFFRINDQICVPKVRLFVEDTPCGIVPLEEARSKAYALGLDLVEIVPDAKPPVCKIIDFGKWKYEEKIKKKEETRKHKANPTKEIQVRYCTGDHDLITKVNMVKKFLGENKQVRIVMKFKNREIAFRKEGENLMFKISTMIEDVGVLVTPKFEGKSLVAKVMPK